MKYISENETVFKSKKDYWLTMHPMKEKETTQLYVRRIKRYLDADYLEKINENSREYHKHRYHNDEQYKEYKNAISLNRYYIKKILKKKSKNIKKEKKIISRNIFCSINKNYFLCHLLKNKKK